MNSIDIFPWNENFNTGIAKIDVQHRKLVVLLNQLASHVAFKADIPTINEILDELANYAVHHFQTEESIWHQHFPDDPLEIKHKATHRGFVETILELRSESGTKLAEKIVEDILAFLTRWLAAHILESDRYLALVVQTVQSGMAVEAAKQYAAEQMSGATKVLIEIILSIYTSLSTNTLHLMQELGNHRRDQEILQHKQLLLFSLLENSPIAVRITAMADGRIVFANKRYAKLINLDAQQIIGTDPKNYYASPQDYDDILRQLEQNQAVTDKLVELSIPGTDRVWTLATYLQIDYEEEPAVLGWFYDVTEIRKTEAELHFLTANISELISHHDSKGKYLFVTPACQSLIGYSEDELLGRSCYEFFHANDLPVIRNIHQQVLEQTNTLTVNYRLRHKGGHFIWAESSVRTAHNGDGKIAYIIATTRDITERKQIETKLADSEARLRAIIENEPECIKIIDAQGCLLMMNPAGLQMIEADRLEQVLGHQALNLVAPKYRKAYAELHKQVLAGNAMQMQFEVLGFKGGCRWMETHAVPMKEANGNIVHLAVTRDITERKKTEQQLRIAATVFESQEGMMVTDANRTILSVNKTFTDITGYSATEIIGKSPRLLRSGKHNNAFYATIWASVSNTGTWGGEIWNRRKNGDIYPAYLTITAVKDQDGGITHYVSTQTDITLRKSAEDEIERLAFYDPLTSLPNRRLLQDRLKSALAASHRHGKQGALLFIDLDNFKNLNDTLGHDMGDLLLQEVAARLTGCVRESDTVARFGGDEFVVMLENLSGQAVDAAKQAETIGHKILAAINQPFQLGPHHYFSTPSIGLTLFCGHQQTTEKLLKQADIAMYQAKISGRNTLRFFDQQMQDIILDRAALEADLRLAIETAQFQLYYQIQMDSTQLPLGAETLIRWQHPTRGLLAPAEFLPLAEETGLILAIGQWVLETACAQLKAWQQDPLMRNLVLSINISAKQFFHTDFIPQVLASIQRHAINPTLLELELTEHLLVANIEEAIIIMDHLAQTGVRFSLDDFGTGYSSLQYLKKLPLKQIKIDQSFIQDLTHDSGAQAIVRTIIAMASGLSLNVIAEGVQTIEQQQLLLNSDCNSYQGYLFSKPIPVGQFEALLKTARA